VPGLGGSREVERGDVLWRELQGSEDSRHRTRRTTAGSRKSAFTFTMKKQQQPPQQVGECISLFAIQFANMSAQEMVQVGSCPCKPQQAS
jgi:hypothetical protein